MRMTPGLRELLLEEGKGKKDTLINYIEQLRYQKAPLSDEQFRYLQDNFKMNVEASGTKGMLNFRTEENIIVIITYSENDGFAITQANIPSAEWGVTNPRGEYQPVEECSAVF